MPLHVGSVSSTAIEIIGAEHRDRDEALRLIAGGGVEPPSQVERNLKSLLHAVATQGLSLEIIAGVRRGGRLTAACTAVLSPGKTALALLGPCDDQALDVEACAGLLREVQHHVWRQDVKLIQSLVSVDGISAATAHRDAGFEYLAELIYCDCQIGRSKPGDHSPCHLTYSAYTTELDDLFAATLERTYLQSHDCPGLGGIRSARDVLVGHRHTGVSDPAALWRLAMRDDEPVGLILLAGVHHRSCLEVVYMGVAAEARGQGIGNALLSQAFDIAQRRRARTLTLAVDSTNAFARRLYERHGFEETARRRAWICRRPF